MKHPAAAACARVAAVALAFTLAAGAERARGGEPKVEITASDLQKIEPRMQRQLASLQYLMNAHQVRQFLSLENEDARRAWIIRFWKANDPTPTTPENEMRTEHYLRADIARADFTRAQWPGWDARGEILVRYGFPDYRAELQSEVTSRKVHPPGELWYYRRHQMIVQFRDINLNGNYSLAITPLGDAQDMSAELAEFLIYDTDDTIQEKIPAQYLDFYRDPELNDTGVEWGKLRERLFGLEPERYLRPRMARETEDIGEVNATDWVRSIPNNPSEVFQREQAQEMATNFQAVLEDTPSSYPFNFEKKTLPFFFDVEQFRAGDGMNRVEVNLQVVVPPAAGPSPEQRDYVAEVSVLDEDFEVVDRQSRRISLPVRADSGTRLMPAQLAFSLPRNYYRLAVSAQGLSEGLSAAYRTNVARRNFDGELAVSDILFAQKIGPVGDNSAFARGPLEVIPHPIRRYAVGTPVPVYFEVYNLGLDEDGRSNYKIEYRVLPHTGEKKGFIERFNGEQAVFASRFAGSGYNAHEPLHLSIGSENLKPGLYDFMVTVKDEYWQSIERRQATFRIVEPSEKP